MPCSDVHGYNCSRNWIQSRSRNFLENRSRSWSRNKKFRLHKTGVGLRIWDTIPNKDTAIRSTHNSNLSTILNSHCQGELNALCNTDDTVLAASPLPRQIHRSEQDWQSEQRCSVTTWKIYTGTTATEQMNAYYIKDTIGQLNDTVPAESGRSDAVCTAAWSALQSEPSLIYPANCSGHSTVLTENKDGPRIQPRCVSKVWVVSIFSNNVCSVPLCQFIFCSRKLLLGQAVTELVVLTKPYCGSEMILFRIEIWIRLSS